MTAFGRDYEMAERLFDRSWAFGLAGVEFHGVMMEYSW